MKIAVFYENIYDGVRATGQSMENVLARFKRAGMDMLYISADSWRRDRQALKRQMENLATPKMIRKLEQYGFIHVGTWSFDDAKKMISRISMNNWRVPAGVIPAEYVPANSPGFVEV